MTIRLLALVLLLGAACASAATPPKKAPIAARDIDVDALARAKDVDASKAVASDETDATAEAGDASTPTDATAESPPAEETATPPESTPAEDTAAPTEPDADKPAAEAAAAPTATGEPVDGTTATAPDEADKRHAQTCETLAQALLDAAEKGDYATATRDFDAQMRTGLPPPKFKAAWESLAQFGKLQARGQSHFAKTEGYIAVSVPLVFEKANLYAQVACNSNDKIAGFYVKPLEIPAP